MDKENLLELIKSSQKTIASMDSVLRDNLRKAAESIKPVSITSDCIWIPAIIVSTNWNANDDVFSPSETLKAASTVVNKPVNWQHNGDEEENEIIGVMTNYVVLDQNYLPATLEDNRPKYHILVGMLVWNKYFPTYAENITEEIDKNILFVSMECLPGNFGFALRKSPADDIILIDKDDTTDWLISKLRYFQGPGVVDLGNVQYQVGRWLKDITFTGVGFVNKPANKESIIVPEIMGKYEMSNSKNNEIFKLVAKNSVLNSSVPPQEVNMGNEAKVNDEMMTKCSALEAELASVKKSLAEAEASIATLKAEKAAMEDNYTQAKAQADEAKKCKAEAEAKAVEAQKAVEASLAEVTAANEKLKTDLASVSSEVAELKSEKKAIARVAEMKALGAVDDEKVAIASFKTMSDEAYAAAVTVAQTMCKKATDCKHTNQKSGTDNTVTNNTPATKAADAAADEAAKAVEKAKADETVNPEVIAKAAEKTNVSFDALQKFATSVLDNR